MKRPEENCYQHSANLFKFCKEALNIKHNYEVKVIDQHVGAILGYDPADSSHWKKGKKNIRSVQTLVAIASHLELDARLVTDIVTGRATIEESLHEYRGYGGYQVSERDQDRELARELLARAQVRSLPVHIPELIHALGNVDLATNLEGDAAAFTAFTSGRFRISLPSLEMRPHTRFLTARELGRILIDPTLERLQEDEAFTSRLNLFASHLLLPAPHFALATLEAAPTRDLVDQLAEFFWVGRSVVNARIKDFLTFNN